MFMLSTYVENMSKKCKNMYMMADFREKCTIYVHII